MMRRKARYHTTYLNTTSSLQNQQAEDQFIKTPFAQFPTFQHSTKDYLRCHKANMAFFGFGNLIYIGVLLINAIAILSEDRFLARINFSSSSYDPAFGAPNDGQGFRTKATNLISSVRTLMRVPLIAINTVIILYELVL
ncbi:Yos1-like-domain-containing protein, partial [Xylariaceae sp. FL0255]